MNAVVRISLAGASFTIDKEGCIVLDNYLNEIGNHYKDEEEKCEILNDIEERIAEIFSERTAPDGVVSMQSVEYAIALLGRPSQIFGEAQDASAGIPAAGIPARFAAKFPAGLAAAGWRSFQRA